MEATITSFLADLDAKNAGLPEKAMIGHEFSDAINQIGEDVSGLHTGDSVLNVLWNALLLQERVINKKATGSSK